MLRKVEIKTKHRQCRLCGEEFAEHFGKEDVCMFCDAYANAVADLIDCYDGQAANNVLHEAFIRSRKARERRVLK